MKGLSVLAAVVVVLLLMMHAWRVSAAGVSPAVSCEPDCTGTSDGSRVPDPMNCTNFYYCVSGAPLEHPVPCDPGNFFDPSIAECAVGSECEAICGPVSGVCPLTCNDTLTVIGDAFDCSIFYYCTIAGPSEAQDCPVTHPYFNGAECVNDASECCKGYCTPYCPGTGFSMVPDPQDCTKYYVCDAEEGIPDENYHFSCNTGMYFGIQAGECVYGPIPDPCPELCDAARDGGVLRLPNQHQDQE